MNPLKNRCLALAALFAAFAVVGCGGGGGGTDDQAQIEKALENVMTVVKPSACERFSTQAFLEQRTGETGAAAVKKCEADAAHSDLSKSLGKVDLSKEISISRVEVDGDSASAAVSFVKLHRPPVQFALQREDGDWKVDGVKAPDATPASKAKIVEDLLKSCGGTASRGEIDDLIAKLDGLPAKRGATVLVEEVKKHCSK